MRLRDENEAMMETLVRAKVELAETQGEQLRCSSVPALALSPFPRDLLSHLVEEQAGLHGAELGWPLCWGRCMADRAVVDSIYVMQVTT